MSEGTTRQLRLKLNPKNGRYIVPRWLSEIAAKQLTFPKRAKRGQPNNFTKAKACDFFAALYMGLSPKRAGFYAGWSEPSMFEYKRIHPKFSELIEAVEGLRTARWIEGVQDDPKWLLERMAREDYNKPTEVTGPGGGPLEITAISAQEATERQAQILEDASLTEIGYTEETTKPRRKAKARNGNWNGNGSKKGNGNGSRT